jgi:endonuclease/exonuclease/phosphatase family metal-dependent hydrolase
MHHARVLVLSLALVASLACGDDDGTQAGDASGGSSSAGTTAADDGSGSTSGASSSGADGSAGSSDGGSSDGGSSTTGAPDVPPLGPWRVMSFNIMCSACTPDGFEPWDDRVPHMGDTIRRHDPDLLGTQELFSGAEVEQLEAELPDYTSIWWVKPDPDSLDYADAAIFYRTGMFEAVEHGFYWLSPNPDDPYSTGFAPPQLPRLVVWARLHAVDEDFDFVFATTHFDNNAPSQELSAPLVLERTASLASMLPVVMVGDFNSDPADAAYTILTEGVDGAGPRFDDSFVLAGRWSSDSNLEPPPEYDPSIRIDHIFVAGAPWQASDWVVDQWGYGPNDHYTSDHFAIAVELSVR